METSLPLDFPAMTGTNLDWGMAYCIAVGHKKHDSLYITLAL